MAKRKSCDISITTPTTTTQEDDPLALSLSPPLRRSTPALPPPRQRRNPTTTPPAGKPPTVPQPFPWATDLRAVVRSLDDIRALGISHITGDVTCKKCTKTYAVEFDLEEKFVEVATFFNDNIVNMNTRAPKNWMSPALLNCRLCGQKNSVKPEIAKKKKAINWVFMFLGQTVGCCTLDQLKYFCKHNKIHRTGAKDRLVYSTYLDLYKQLHPNGPSTAFPDGVN